MRLDRPPAISRAVRSPPAPGTAVANHAVSRAEVEAGQALLVGRGHHGTSTLTVSTTHAGLPPPARSMVTRAVTW